MLLPYMLPPFAFRSLLKSYLATPHPQIPLFTSPTGCAGMKEGGKRRLTIPPEKGYGRGGAPPTIPGNATLICEVTLLEVI